jgi:tetratricopeptide (TPR) repeat protein
MYPHPTSEIDLNDVKIAAICLLAVSIIALLLVRRWPVVLVGWLWYLGLLVPVIGIVQVGGQAMADRYTYLPQIGIAMALVWTADGLLRWINQCARYFALDFRPLAAIAIACIVAALAAVGWRQTTFWRNSESLWTRDLSMYADRNAVANYNLGMTVADLGRHEEAIALYRKALTAIPDDQDSFINMGLSLAALGRYDEAVKAYSKAIELKSSVWIAHKNLGLALKEQGKVADAVAEWRKAIDLRFEQEKKEIPDLLATTARILAASPDDKLRNPAEAIVLATRAVVATKHADATALDTQAIAYAAAGRFSDALTASREALELLPESVASNAVQIAAIRDRMDLYHQGKPYRDAK